MKKKNETKKNFYTEIHVTCMIHLCMYLIKPEFRMLGLVIGENRRLSIITIVCNSSVHCSKNEVFHYVFPQTM